MKAAVIKFPGNRKPIPLERGRASATIVILPTIRIERVLPRRPWNKQNRKRP